MSRCALQCQAEPRVVGEALSRRLPATNWFLRAFYAQVCVFTHLVIIFDLFFPTIRQNLFQEPP